MLPTDTVYGIGTRPDDPAATARLFEAKGRPRELELPVLVPSTEAARRIATFDERAEALALRFWAGPLTIVLPRADAAPGVGPRRRSADDRRPDAARPARARGARAHGAARRDAARTAAATPRPRPATRSRRRSAARSRCTCAPPNRSSGSASTVVDLAHGGTVECAPRRGGIRATSSPTPSATSADVRSVEDRVGRLSPPMASILVVCTGNVCRSPIAEGFLRAAFEARMGSRRARGRIGGDDGVDGFGRGSRARSRRPPSAGSTSRATARASVSDRRGGALDADPRDGPRARGRGRSRPLGPGLARSRSRSWSVCSRRSPSATTRRVSPCPTASPRPTSCAREGSRATRANEDDRRPARHAARRVPGRRRGAGRVVLAAGRRARRPLARTRGDRADGV